jgi:hypothetical protein
MSGEDENRGMKKLLRAAPSLDRNRRLAGLIAFALVAAMPAWQIVHAQAPERAPLSIQAAVHRHVEGLALAHLRQLGRFSERFSEGRDSFFVRL